MNDQTTPITLDEIEAEVLETLERASDQQALDEMTLTDGEQLLLKLDWCANGLTAALITSAKTKRITRERAAISFYREETYRLKTVVRESLFQKISSLALRPCKLTTRQATW